MWRDDVSESVGIVQSSRGEGRQRSTVARTGQRGRPDQLGQGGELALSRTRPRGSVLGVENAGFEGAEGVSDRFEIGGPVPNATRTPGVSGVAFCKQTCIGEHFEVQADAVSRHVERVHQLGGGYFAVGDDEPQECDAVWADAKHEAGGVAGFVGLGFGQSHSPHSKNVMHSTLQDAAQGEQSDRP